MAVTKRVLCLANSRKPSGRCVAGLEMLPTGPGPWVRPVSARPGEEVSEHERQYENGSDPRVLDVIDLPLLQHTPHACQTENWRLDPDHYWRLVRQADWDELQAYVENPETLWINGVNTYHGLNDEMTKEASDGLPRSLYLIRVPRVDLRVFAPGEAFGNPKRRVQACFRHANTDYWLWVTDPIVEKRYLALADGTHVLGECCLTLSLGEPFVKSSGGLFRHKLAAAVIERKEA